MTINFSKKIWMLASASLVGCLALALGCAVGTDAEFDPETGELIGQKSAAVIGASGVLTHSNWPSPPVCAHSSTGPSKAAYVRAGKVYYRKYAAGAWGAEIDTWLPAGVTSFTRVAMAQTTSAITRFAAFGNDGKLYQKSVTSNAQGGWSTQAAWPLPDTTRGLAVASEGVNQTFHAFYYLPGAGTRQLAHVWFDGSTWQVETGATVTQLRINGSGLLAAAAWSSNRLDVIATTGSLVHLSNGGGGGGWTQVTKPYMDQDTGAGAFAISGVAMTSTGSGNLDLFLGNSTSNKLMYSWFRSNQWSMFNNQIAFDQVGGVSPGTQVGGACDANGGLRMDVFGTLTGGNGWQAYWNSFGPF